MSFSQFNLHENINKALVLCGYTVPTHVQVKSIPEIMEGRDVVVSASTGSGKTAAFVLPSVNRLISGERSKKPRVLVLTPTRELASQIQKAAMTYGKFSQFNIISLVGGMSYTHQIKDLARGADIIVATPGRLMDHMEQKRVDLSSIEILVLDEADRMLDMGFIDDVQYIAKLTPANRQTLLFSATLDSKLMGAVRHLLKNPVRIDLSNEKQSAPRIEQLMVKANSPHHKTKILKQYLSDESIYKAIIFSATKINCDKLAMQLREDGFSVAALHGDLKQNVRNRTLEQLRNGKVQFLVATDVAARGIDVSDITHVINYDLPKFCEDYVHRIGRTGRADKTGIAISLVLPTDGRNLQRIERFTGQRIKMVQPPAGTENFSANASNPQSNERFASDDDYKPAYKEGRSSRSAKSDGYKPASREGRPNRFAKTDDYKPASREGRPSRFAKSDGYKPASREDRPSRFGKSDGYKPASREDRPSRFGKSDDYRPASREDRPSRFAKTDDYKPASREDRPSRFGKSDGYKPASREDRPSRFAKTDDYKPASREGRPSRFAKTDDYKPASREGRPSRFAKSDTFKTPLRDGRPSRFAKSAGPSKPRFENKEDRQK